MGARPFSVSPKMPARSHTVLSLAWFFGEEAIFAEISIWGKRSYDCCIISAYKGGRLSIFTGGFDKIGFKINGGVEIRDSGSPN
jgi:hypothetical protein